MTEDNSYLGKGDPLMKESAYYKEGKCVYCGRTHDEFGEPLVMTTIPTAGWCCPDCFARYKEPLEKDGKAKPSSGFKITPVKSLKQKRYGPQAG